MDKLTVVTEWRKYADADLDAAQYMAHNMWPTHNHIICFHCQQAAEKYLKGFLILHDEIPPHIHDLDTLWDSCVKYDAAFTEIERACSDLSRYGVQPRYPLEIHIDGADMSRALNQAETVQTFMQRVAPEMFASS
jgi:HEPN domain-containing protein